jgi:hypothetical protein
MICHQEKRTIARCGLDVFETVNVHDVVSGKMNPARAEDFLAPRPKALPAALVHARAEAKGEPFEGG